MIYDGVSRCVAGCLAKVGRHLEIDESTVTITEMLSRHLPLDLILVRRFHLANSSLETVAWGSHGEDPTTRESRTEINPTRLKRLMAWAGSGKVLRNRSSKPTGEIATLAGEGVEGDLLAGPLVGPDGPLGVLVIRATSGATFNDEHIAMHEALLDPFSAALGNDLRLHELASLREAAEADKRSLLTRLGRRDVGETIVGSEAGLRPVMERVELVSQSDVPVLILGETGTGKEVVSRRFIRARVARALRLFASTAERSRPS
ncbi:MAG: sigma 54-interacting transcriptional regulator [Pirellulales bacterium]